MKKIALLTLAIFSLPLQSFALTNSVIAEEDQWTPVVQIKSEAPDANGESIPGYCNATFVSNNLLVTAAHCVLLAHVSNQTQLDIEIGYYKYVTRPDGQRVRIGYTAKSKFSKHVNIQLPQSLQDKVNRSGARTKIGPNEDFAIVWWNEATPETAEMKFSPLVTPAEHAQITRSLASHPLKVLSINFFSTSDLNTKRQADLNNVRMNGNYVHSQSVARVEEGDSGAPVFARVNNQMKLFAVVKGRATTIFSNWDVYPTIHPHLCDMNKRMPTTMKLSVCAN